MKMTFRSLASLLWLVLCLSATAATNTVPVAPDESVIRQNLVQAVSSSGADQQKLLNELGETGSKLVSEVLLAWTRGGIYFYESPDGSKVPVLLEEQQDADGKVRAIRLVDGQAVKDESGKELRFADSDLTSADTDMRLRSAIQQTLDTLALSNPDPDARWSAVTKISNSQKESYIPILQARLTKETDERVKKAIDEALASLQLADRDPAVQINAIKQLASLGSIGSLAVLQKIAGSTNGNPQVIQAARQTVGSIEQHIWRVNFFGTIFRGVSLGSILLVVALGLAITFGLMGVINMAHGEMIAVGAYTTYVVQNIFGAGFSFAINLPFSIAGKQLGFGLSLPGLNATGWFYQSYFLFAIPLSFIMAALAGLVLERTVIQFLYRRPLESLLATWGVSLVMQQMFRMVFGANNVQVNSPSWLLGHFTIHDVSFGYNRVFVVGFAILIVIGTWLLLSKTPLGLLIRAVMQNRAMASCMGVRTTRVNMMTFAFGSGLAGLAGAFLSQIGNVGPSLGQSYIVDSFMTVVVGGVGSIIGTVYSALGIGVADQVLQQQLGSPVMGKIIVLTAIILFLQWKPGGLFSIRSRNLD
ncbi:MAG: urea ABC transporter permease subunit UrtB [Verrucomicrobiales bacterium]|nr:urea ABC transporter permease subunit UrtB [Verrucomicrobiales bacterium]